MQTDLGFSFQVKWRTGNKWPKRWFSFNVKKGMLRILMSFLTGAEVYRFQDAGQIYLLFLSASKAQSYGSSKPLTITVHFPHSCAKRERAFQRRKLFTAKSLSSLDLFKCVILSTQAHKRKCHVLNYERKTFEFHSPQLKKILIMLLRHLGDLYPAFGILCKHGCPILAALHIAVIKLCFHFRVMKTEVN